MNREIDPAREHRLVDLAGEERRGSDARQRNVLDDVAGGADVDPLGDLPRAGEERPDPLRLPGGERASPGADSQRGEGAHDCAVPAPTSSCAAVLPACFIMFARTMT